MKRTFVIASHSTLAAGMTAALKFFAGDDANIIELNAYLDNKPIGETIQEIFAERSEDEEVVVLTDLLAGSVNQNFFNYKNRPHTHIFTGMNMALGLSLLLEPTNDYLDVDRIRSIV
ncbi:PTS sugar transporter subunit IIA [Lactococcus lactis]|uniref:PTS sugar transporter subunit IIA n=1 Tax=Lactococcus lactis TaxID=1358 RepID=UPI003568F064